MAKNFRELFTEQNKRLFHLLLYHQIYLEGVKGGFAGDYTVLLRTLYAEFGRLIFSQRYQNLDQFSKLELISFIRQFQNAQMRFYSAYTKRLIDALKEFLATDIEVTNLMVDSVILPKTVSAAELKTFSEAEQSAFDGLQLDPAVLAEQTAEPVMESDAGTKEGNDKLWQLIIDEPIPANGYKPVELINRFNANAMASVIALINQGYANAWTTQRLFKEIVGTNETNFRDGLLARSNAQNKAAIGSVLQFISSNAQLAVLSKMYSEYQWVSVLDSHTTEICRERNGNIYKFGEGPIPPAHYYCRSKIVPVIGNIEHDIPNEQKQELRTAMDNAKPMSIADFVAKIKKLIGE